MARGTPGLGRQRLIFEVFLACGNINPYGDLSGVNNLNQRMRGPCISGGFLLEKPHG